MNLIEKIKTAFAEAYKAEDMDLKNVIGTIKGEIERSAKDPKNISDDEVTKSLKSMLKKHDENPSLTDVEIELFYNSASIEIMNITANSYKLIFDNLMPGGNLYYYELIMNNERDK